MPWGPTRSDGPEKAPREVLGRGNVAVVILAGGEVSPGFDGPKGIVDVPRSAPQKYTF